MTVPSKDTLATRIKGLYHLPEYIAADAPDVLKAGRPLFALLAELEEANEIKFYVTFEWPHQSIDGKTARVRLKCFPHNAPSWSFETSALKMKDAMRDASELFPMHDKVRQLKRLEPNNCNVCGFVLVEVRGRHPQDPKRNVCPQCAIEALDDLKEILNRGSAKQA